MPAGSAEASATSGWACNSEGTCRRLQGLSLEVLKGSFMGQASIIVKCAVKPLELRLLSVSPTHSYMPEQQAKAEHEAALGFSCNVAVLLQGFCSIQVQLGTSVSQRAALAAISMQAATKLPLCVKQCELTVKAPESIQIRSCSPV